jgi:hypothetical protein
MSTAWMFSSRCALGLFGLVAACSDPVPPAAQGSASLYLTNNAMMGTNCPPFAHWVNVPWVKGSGQQTYASVRPAPAIDGQDQAAVNCSVKANGSTFDVSGSLKSPATDNMGTPVNPTVITIRTTITADTPAPGAVSILDDKTATTYSSEACTFSAHPLQAGIDKLEVAAGRFWGSVTCPKFNDPSNPDMNALCQISPGFVVLENCAQ